jgi:aconitase A
MSVVLAAERMLYSVEKKDIPDELLKHLEANEAKGCGGCWMCSNPNRMHKDCQIKIDRWFATQQVLLEYARNFPARNGLSQL